MRVGAKSGGDPCNSAGIARPPGAARGLFARQVGERIVHRSIDHELLGGVISDQEGVEPVGDLGRGGGSAARERALELGSFADPRFADLRKGDWTRVMQCVHDVRTHP